MEQASDYNGPRVAAKKPGSMVTSGRPPRAKMESPIYSTHGPAIPHQVPNKQHVPRAAAWGTCRSIPCVIRHLFRRSELVVGANASDISLEGSAGAHKSRRETAKAIAVPLR